VFPVSVFLHSIIINLSYHINGLEYLVFSVEWSAVKCGFYSTFMCHKYVFPEYYRTETQTFISDILSFYFLLLLYKLIFVQLFACRFFGY